MGGGDGGWGWGVGMADRDAGWGGEEQGNTHTCQHKINEGEDLRLQI